MNEQYAPIELLNGNDSYNTRPSVFSLVFSIVTNVALYVMMLLIIMYVMIVPVPISGTSMLNTIESGETAVVQKHLYSVKRGDIVIVDLVAAGKHAAGSPVELIIKRVVAVGGDSFAFKFTGEKHANKPVIGLYLKKSGESEYTLVDEKDSIKEPMTNTARFTESAVFRILKETEAITDENATLVGKNRLLVLGDNRDISIDSRRHGLFPVGTLYGKYLKSVDSAFLDGFFKILYIRRDTVKDGDE